MLRSRNLLTSLVLLAGLGLPLLATPAARAGLIPNKITVTPDGENFRWTYNVVVTSDLYVSKGDFFTIYDFAGADPATVTMPANWVMSTANTTAIPPKYGSINPNDDPNIANYTFTYTGDSAVFGSAGLGNFSFVTPYSGKAGSVFASVNHRPDDATNVPDPQEFNLTPTTVPVAAPPGGETPEPATLLLAACGLPVAGLLRLRRKRK